MEWPTFRSAGVRPRHSYGTDMTLHGKNFIAGQLSAGGGHAVPATSPINRATLEPPFFQATEREVDQALASAAQAFETFRETSGEERASLLERIADRLRPSATR